MENKNNVISKKQIILWSIILALVVTLLLSILLYSALDIGHRIGYEKCVRELVQPNQTSPLLKYPRPD
jgi:putative exporter of polyketide antibiotics